MENQSLAQKPWAAVAAPAVAQKALSPQLSPLALRTWQSLHGAEVSPTEPSCLSPLPQCQQWAGVYPTLTRGLRPQTHCLLYLKSGCQPVVPSLMWR